MGQLISWWRHAFSFRRYNHVVLCGDKAGEGIDRADQEEGVRSRDWAYSVCRQILSSAVQRSSRQSADQATNTTRCHWCRRWHHIQHACRWGDNGTCLSPCSLNLSLLSQSLPALSISPLSLPFIPPHSSSIPLSLPILFLSHSSSPTSP